MSSTATKNVRNQMLVDASGEPGRYTGPVLLIDPNNATATASPLPHGPNGDMHYTNGRRYRGDWDRGKWNGERGKAWFPNGDTYDGDYRCDQRHGLGKYTWRDGRSYSGSFVSDVRHGQGKYTWQDQRTTYAGTFQQGQRQGHGMYDFDGGKYVGEFARGQYHGSGECTWDDGRKYKGEWQDGMAHGQGVETDGLGRILHDGRWQHDEPLSMSKGAESVASAATSTVKTIFDGFPKLPSMFSTTVTPVEPTAVVNPYDEDDDEKLEPVVNQIVSDARGREGSFRGMVLRGVPHGVGHMIYKSTDPASGEIYQGFWEYGDWKQGRVEYQNGDVFHGDFRPPNNARSGQGQYIWADGRQYEGEWQHDLRHGQGQFHYPNGDYFQGTFQKGMRHGHGRFEFHDGSLFDGGFKKGQFHGQGCKYVLRDGRVYLGDFVDGVRSGYGKENYPNGMLRYEGEWVDNEPLLPNKIQPAPPGFILQDDADDDDANDMASLASEISKTPSIVTETKDCTTVVEEAVKDAQGNPGTYTGLVLKGVPHGVGRMVYTGEIREGFWKHGYLEGHARAFFANGDFYEGMFIKSQRQGKGVYKWKDGRIYEGDYIDDQRHGTGRFVYPSGDEYVGDYDLGMRSGLGKFTFADGSNYNGGWHDSMYHGYGELKEVSGNYFKGEWKEGKKHGKGHQYNVAERQLLKGHWEADIFVKVEDSDNDKDGMLDDGSEKALPIESTGPRKQSFKWGAFDGENRRWQPLEKADAIPEQQSSDDDMEPEEVVINETPVRKEKETQDEIVEEPTTTPETDGAIAEDEPSEVPDTEDAPSLSVEATENESTSDKPTEETVVEADSEPNTDESNSPTEPAEESTDEVANNNDCDWLKVSQSNKSPP